MSFINGKIAEFVISTQLLVYACTKFDEIYRYCLFSPNKDKGLNLDGVNYKVLGYCPVLNGKICGFCTLNFSAKCYETLSCLLQTKTKSSLNLVNVTFIVLELYTFINCSIAKFAISAL